MLGMEILIKIFGKKMWDFLAKIQKYWVKYKRFHTTRISIAASANPNEAKGRIFKK
jgi:hypothetical protein